MSAQYRPYRDEEGSDGLDNERLNWSDHEPGSIQIYEKTTEELPFHATRRAALGTIGLALICLLSGFLIGYISHLQHSECVPSMSVSLNSVKEADPNIRNRLLSMISADSIRSIVREFSREPRIPGTQIDFKLAKQVADFFHAHNLDKVEIKNYSVLLSLPDENKPNSVEIHRRDSGSDFLKVYSTLPSPTVEKVKNYASPYSAYSPDAEVIGDVVYVNYGQASDYQELQRLNVSVAGKILIAKQMQLHADEQVLHAQEVEALGLLLFPDITRNDWRGEESASNIPRDAVRRDSLLWNGMGDPQTPHYPSTYYAYRMPLHEIKVLPKIPVQPISIDAAYEILGLLGGRRAPDGWVGAFNFTYHIGGFQNKSLKVHMNVHNKLVNRTIYNVIGYIRGNVEPDRYVMIGNHRDSWVDGAIDAAGGTGALLELSKVYGDLLKEGWRPRRTIMFCSWGAEEFNLMGSTEWLEEHIKLIQARSVAYINTDIVAVGNASASVASSPLLYQVIFNATKQVQHPNGEKETVYDRWHSTFPISRNYTDMLFGKKNERESADYLDLEREHHFSRQFENSPTIDYTEPAVGSLLSSYINSAMVRIRPRVRPLDMRSAAAPFFTSAGVPALEITYVPTPKNAESISSTYSLIHTQYDTIDLIDTFDKSYACHRAVTQTLGEVVRNLADSLFLPFNLLDYAQVLRDMYLALQLHAGLIFEQNGLELNWLDSAIHNFTEAALKFHMMQDKLDTRDPMAIRRVNDQLLLLERAFLDSNGLPRNPMKRHIVLSPSETGAPYDEFFPGLMDEFALLVHADFTDLTIWSWDMIKAHYSILVYTIQTAASVISDVV